MKLVRKVSNFMADGVTPLVSVVAEDANGESHTLGPFNYDPSDDEIVEALPAPPKRLAPTAATGKAVLKGLLDDQLADAQAWDWFNTKIQADAGVGAGAKTAVAKRATAEYTEAKRLAVAWAQAT